jgi:Ca2+-binding RTX toxin-like protein
MSAMMIIMLSALTLFGVILIDPEDGATTEPADPTPEPEDPVEGGTSPLSEATDSTPSVESASTDVPQSVEETSDPIDTGNATISGSVQSDVINAGDGNDIVDGRLGDDTISGGTGSDNVSGGLGNDVLYGGDIDGDDDGEDDTLNGGEGDDRIYIGNTDIAEGGSGADTFVRLSNMTSRALVSDFDRSEDVIVIEYENDPAPTVETQTIASDGVILDLSDGSRIELAGLTEAIDPSLISFVDIR